MNSNVSLKYPKSAYLLSISKGLERTAYYGIRSILVLYMTSEIIQMDSKDGLAIYGWFGTLVTVSGVVGAALGDLVIGHKKAVIYGAVVQALGAFILALSSEVTLYIGTVLLIVGIGMHNSNFRAFYGTQFRATPRLLDSGFAMLFVVINLGAMAGPFFIGALGEINYSFGFFAAGIIMILSLILFQISKPQKEITIQENQIDTSKKNNMVWMVLLGVSAFWAFYGLFNACNYGFQMKFGNLLHISRAQFSMINTAMFTFPLGIVAAIYWARNYSSQLTKFKIAIGFAIAGFCALLLLSDTLNHLDLSIYVLGIFLLALAEIFISPVLFSSLAQYGNPKYLALLMSLVFVPTRLFSSGLGFFNSYLVNFPKMTFAIGIVGLSLLYAILYFFTKAAKPKENQLYE